MYSCFFTCYRSSGRTILFPRDSDSKGLFLCAPPPLSLGLWKHNYFILQGITTYEYVVAMRAHSEPPGPSVDGGDQLSLPSSPTSSAVTATSGRSSLAMGLQHKGAWCTPPRIFMDLQVLMPIPRSYMFSENHIHLREGPACEANVGTWTTLSVLIQPDVYLFPTHQYMYNFEYQGTGYEIRDTAFLEYRKKQAYITCWLVYPSSRK